MDKTLVLKPRVSEKAYGMSQGDVYVFMVPKSASKPAIASAVKAQFDVTVTDVNTVVVKGKAKRTIRKGGRPVMGRQSDFKKAYVTLKEGDSITVFAAEDDNSSKSTKKETK